MIRVRGILSILLVCSITIIGCNNKETGEKQEAISFTTEESNLGNSKIEESNQKENNEIKESVELTDEEMDAVTQEVVVIEPYWPTEEWRKTSPESVGMESAYLFNMFRHIKEQSIPMEGFIVVKDGYIIAEKYGGEYSKETTHPIYSVTKSLTSALVGIAINQDEINSVNDRINTYLQDDKIIEKNRWKSDLTIKHFLTMKSGLDFPEQTQRGFYQSNTWKEFMSSNDPAYYVLNRPIRENPDTWNYSTGDARVVSKIIQEATGTKLSDYAEQHLFSPLGIRSVEWPTDSSETSFGGTGVLMKPRDIAKIGYLYLKDGKWGNRQLLPDGWVKESTTPYVDTKGNFDGAKYGYYFWLKEVGGFDTYRGMGLYGQYMVVIPDLDLVVIQTSSGMDVDPLLEEYIIPSIK